MQLSTSRIDVIIWARQCKQDMTPAANMNLIVCRIMTCVTNQIPVKLLICLYKALFTGTWSMLTKEVLHVLHYCTACTPNFTSPSLTHLRLEVMLL
jgi:hypothetical protein